MEEKFLKVLYTILELKDLNGDDKLMLSLIISYHVNNRCIATNEYFGKKFGYSKTSASERISKLKRLGYIQTSSYTFNNKTYRKIIPVDWTKNKEEVVGFVEGGVRFG